MQPELLDACDLNWWRAMGCFLGSSLRGEALESRELWITSCGFPAVEFNRAFLRRPEGDVARALARAEAYFGAAELPFLVSVRSDRAVAAPSLEAAGYALREEVPMMWLRDLGVVSVPRVAPSLAIRRVEGEDELRVFAETACEGFGIPVGAARIFFPPELLRQPELRLYLGRVDGEAACTSALYESPGIAGIYWVATLERFRGRGLGEAITWAAVLGAAEAGHHGACLQASKLGAPVYARMGFETPVHYRQYGRDRES